MVRAISLHQPWASFVALGVKEIETRGWSTDYRGPLVIHAAKSIPTYARRAMATVEIERLMSQHDLDMETMPRGALLATVELVDVLPTHMVESDISDTERALGDYGHNRFAWILAYPRMLDAPVPYRGHQSFWSVPPEVLT